MKKRIWIPVLLALACCSFSFIGCTQTSSPASAQVTPQKTTIGADLQKKIRASKLKFQLYVSNGTGGTLYFYADDETVQTATGNSCYANTGDTVRTGGYDLYFEPIDKSSLQKQDVPLFPHATLDFDDTFHQYQRYTDPQKRLPDLLMLKQTLACSGSEIAFLQLSFDGQRVQQLTFKQAGTSKSMIVAKTFDRVAPDRFQTTFYNNAKGTNQTITWKWLPDQQEMVEQSETTTKRS